MAHTPTPWKAFNMVHSERGDAMTPDELGEYVKNNVIKSVESGGSLERFLFISTDGENAPDICHVGNGPRGPDNAAFIVLAVNSHDALVEALTEAEKALAYASRGEQDTADLAKYSATIDKIRAALALATEPVEG